MHKVIVTVAMQRAEQKNQLPGAASAAGWTTAESRGRFPQLAKVESDIPEQCKSYQLSKFV
jgi:hypothetical protein